MAQNNPAQSNAMSHYRPPPYGQRPKGLPFPIINNYQVGDQSNENSKH